MKHAVVLRVKSLSFQVWSFLMYKSQTQTVTGGGFRGADPQTDCETWSETQLLLLFFLTLKNHLHKLEEMTETAGRCGNSCVHMVYVHADG